MTTSTETPTVIRQSDSIPSGPSRLVRFLGRLILAFLKLLPLFIIVVVLLAVAWLGYQELNRSFGAINSRVDWTEEQVTQLRDEISIVSSSISAQQTQQSELAVNTELVDGRISAVNEDLAGQNEMLVALEEQLAAVETSAGSYAGRIDTLGEGLITVQENVTANGEQIDNLGGQIDTLAIDVTTLRGDIEANSEALTQKEAIVAQLSKTLTIFRIWETVARARLRLVDENIGLAQVDIEIALSILNQISTEETGDLADALQQTQNRLNLAANNLPANPEAAVRDLNTAWEALDTALTTMLEEVSQAEPTREGE